MRFGAVYLTPLFEMKEIGVDTNVFNTPTDPVKDFTMTLVPKVTAWVPVQRRALLTTSLSTDFVYYAKSSGERSVNPDISVRGDIFLRRISLFVSDAILSSRERPSFEIDARSRRHEKKAEIGIGYALTPKTSIEASVNRSTFDYDQDTVFFGTNLRTGLNRTSDGYGLRFRNKMTPKTTLVLEVRAQKDRFDFSPAKNADRLRILPGFVFTPRALISGALQVGLQRFRTVSEVTPDYTGLLAAVDVGFRLAAQELGFRFSRDVSSSFELSEPFYVNTGVGGQIRRQLLGRADGIVSVDRYVYAYKGSARPGAERRDVTKNFTIDIGYRMSPTTRLGVAATRWNRATTVTARSYRGWRIGAVATIGR